MAKLTEEEKAYLRELFEKLIEQDCVNFSVNIGVGGLFGERDTTLTLRAKGE
ncbi:MULTISPECIES: hypothetical protein [Bacillus]|jgi:hypothetical protein|uniref:hypothetical protein n=1 Tax=Bacillus TaxID=1386 RepID=UPI000A6877ED|nr:hypothetical protein [Bacillus licheniformis]MBT1249444.1 hypothetical protein [Bacillus licheniformis]MBY8831930.1 hypothetical protein [Bacillus licheniformis]MCM3209186.1 hypothetical protein [Bacillus licheniformis]MCM3284794.1 hypothetical protein [Bacillus licheniformis]MCY7743811.1 hypothetical protein [Bacillus licheniformis]